MLPLEFVVIGEPVSHQSHNKTLRRHWQARVREAAEAVWPKETAPSELDCLLIVTYYYGANPVLLDNDNLVKPIQDALNGLVYNDDSQVTDTMIRRTRQDQPFRFTGLLVARALQNGEEFVYVRVEEAPDHGIPL